MTKSISLALAMAIVVQFLVLTGVFAFAVAPLWLGTEIQLATQPVDPRSLFRGNYARLGYDFSTIDVSQLPDSDDLRNGEVVYVSLKPAPGDLHVFAGVSLVKPEAGVFLRGRIQNKHYDGTEVAYRMNYGIEAFFAPKDKAIALEHELRSGGVAIVRVSDSGRARLKDVVPPP